MSSTPFEGVLPRWQPSLAVAPVHDPGWHPGNSRGQSVLRWQRVLGHSAPGQLNHRRSITSSKYTSPAERQSAAGARQLVGRDRELAMFEELLTTVRRGGSSSLLVRGEPGIGKSALLEHAVESASGFQIVRAIGVEGEVDLPYAGLQQLCRSMSETIEVLPQPQREALRVVFGLASGEPADRYLVGLATLTLMSEVAATQPLLCVVDDAQWLDAETTGALAFVSRRLGADSVGFIFASREIVEDLESVPEVQLAGLNAAESLALLHSVLMGHPDAPVRERLLAEAHGNPLALIELPRALTSAEAATGILRPSGGSLSGRIEDGFRRRLEPLPEETRQLLLLAAAEPLGDPLLLFSAASRIGLGMEAADAAEEAGLLEIRERFSFRHPLVRSAVYQSATQRDRRLAHAALAEATGSELDPDRKAWHRAQATPAPDEDVAADLERTAARARSRGGLAAAGTFLERAAMLTPDPGKRAARSLVAAGLMYEAGAFDSVEKLLIAVDADQLDEIQAAQAERLRAEVSLALGKDQTNAIVRLLAAADRVGRADPSVGYSAHLEALRWAFYLGDPKLLTAVAEALDRSTASRSGEIAELMVRGWAQMLDQGYPAGTDLLRDATIALRDKIEVDESDLLLLEYTEGITRSLWDLDSWETLARRTVVLARESGALLTLPRVLYSWSTVKVATGEFGAAATALAEADAIAEATGATRDWRSSWLDTWRYDEAEALRRIALQEQSSQAVPWFYEYARAVLYNAAGRYEAALGAAQRSCDVHPLGTHAWALVELVEAAARCGQHDRAKVALEQLVDRTRLGSTEWALGLECRCAALLGDDPAAVEPLYREAVERLGRARTTPDLARAHLVYGEWLRREGRRLDAREQLRTAHDMFSAIGIPGFAERARRELAGSGETARRRTDDTRGDLTGQESQIAQLASEGMTNPEIGAKLFLSPRTVEWHLRRIYPKLGVSSRRELRGVLHAI